jgi:DNA polymerase delta subunit 1
LLLENAQDAIEGKPIIRLFGVTEAGNSVVAHVHNFTAYFYAHVVEEREFDHAEIENFRIKLSEKVQMDNRSVQGISAIIRID